MMEPLIAIVLIPIACLLALAAVPRRLVETHAKSIRQLVTWLAGVQLAVAFALAVTHAVSENGFQLVSFFAWLPSIGLGLDVYYDGATSLMLALVSFVGFIVSRFSIRYLDGEATQGRYFQWLSFTIGAVSLMVVAGNLVLFFVAWVMTSFGLHQLLLHYRHRPAAHRAAWTKFTVSRIGDTFLIAAMVLTFRTFGTFSLPELFLAAQQLADAAEVTASHTAIGWLLVLGAVTKSAQFPFHTWLPDTMETPTPVSALMHAGIVNAGGYLIIRMSPLVALAPSALVTLALIGAFTTCFAGVVMVTQPSVKRALAYSTIAQMGFMMLQCGLGAFAAAMLHIVAHSLYKAHAFLSSGSVVAEARATSGAKSQKLSATVNAAYLLAAALVAAVTYAAVTFTFEVDLFAKSGGIVLAFIFCLALTTWGWRLFGTADAKTALTGVAGIAGLCLAYVASYLVVALLLGDAMPAVSASLPLQLVGLGIVVAFCLLFVLHAIVTQRLRPNWLEALRVHAANGFYIDAVYRRVFAPLPRS